MTRPEPGAARTAARLMERGFEPVVLPLTETRALPVDVGVMPDDVDAVAVTSASAVRHAPKDLIGRLAALPCHAVGRRTAEAARKAGFRQVHEGGGDAEALAAAMARQFAGKSLVYLCGRVRFPGFETSLATAQVRVIAVETYDTVAIDYPDGEIMRRLSGKPVDVVLFYSAKAAEAMRALARRPALCGLFDAAMYLCLSSRIGIALESPAGEKIRVASEPNEDALLSLLSAGG